MVTKPGSGALEQHICPLVVETSAPFTGFFFCLIQTKKQVNVLGHSPFKINRLQE